MKEVGREYTNPRTSALPGAPNPFPVSCLSDLLALSAENLAAVDIAVMNMLCAEGLPGAEDLNIPQCLDTLDGWTRIIKRYTRDCSDYYQRDPEQYHHHKGFAKLASMAIFLKRAIGIRYQPTAIGNFDFIDSRDDMLHGLLTRKLGTCSSLPVLCVAIGRRLGYPMYVAMGKAHVLCQWLNQDGTHLNFEVSGDNGDCSAFDDKYYHTWPRPLTEEELASGRFLRPLNAPESLALFLETRGHCLTDNRRFDEARHAYDLAHRIAPQWSRTELFLPLVRIREQKYRAAAQRPVLSFTSVDSPMFAQKSYSAVVSLPGFPLHNPKR